MQSEESNMLVKLAKAVIEHAPEGSEAFLDIKFSDIEAAMSAAEPIATVAEMGAGGMRVLMPHPPGSVDRLPIGTKLYDAPPAPSVAVKALRWKGPDSYGEYHSLDGLWGYIIRCEDDGHWLTEVGEYFRSPEAAKAAAQADYEARIRSDVSAQVQDVADPDDLAVDRFALAMKAKLAQKRAEGRGGWDNPDECSVEWLSELLIRHIKKGDPIDVGNFAMMIHQRGGRISR